MMMRPWSDIQYLLKAIMVTGEAAVAIRLYGVTAHYILAYPVWTQRRKTDLSPLDVRDRTVHGGTRNICRLTTRFRQSCRWMLARALGTKRATLKRDVTRLMG